MFFYTLKKARLLGKRFAGEAQTKIKSLTHDEDSGTFVMIKLRHVPYAPVAWQIYDSNKI